ncbi:MAG: family 20 glycosylhydrolase [Traorella sp.]
MKIKKIISKFIVFALVAGMLPSVHTQAYDPVDLSASDEMILYPQPRSVVYEEGYFDLVDGTITSDDDTLKAITKIQKDASEFANVDLVSGKDVVVKIAQDTKLSDQGYSLVIDKNGISITYKDEPGAYYASTTLNQILYQCGAKLPYLTIENDYPDFQYRGFDMDISRNRIPNMDTLKRVVELMSNLKFNQMFLYFEGFSYAYESYPQVWAGGDPLTPQQAKEISEYANALGIDVIPMQNSFGHSYQWIAHNDFKELGDTDTSSTLNVLDTKTQTFLSNIYDDLFDGFTSDFIHVCGDETTLDLTNGRAAASYREIFEEEPTQGALYIESMRKIYEIATSKGKDVFYWADMIINHDTYEEAKEAMPDGIAMDWGYLYDYDFASHVSKFEAADIDFYVCPGDSSWSTITGNTYVMKKNAENAAKVGKESENAVGYLMTNWGDAGHYQNIITTYPAIAYAGGLSWCYDTNVETEEGYNTQYDLYLNKFLYQDSTNTLSQAFSELADFSNNYLPYGWNGNWIANCFVEAYTDNSRLMEFMDFEKDGRDYKITPEVRDLALEQCKQVADAAVKFLEKLETVDIQADDAEILYKEFKNTAEVTKIAADYVAMRLRLFVGESITEPISTKKDEVATAIANAQEFQSMLKEFKEIWNARDAYGELPTTLGWISKPSMMYRDIAGVQNIYKPQEDGNLFLKTPETIGTNLAVDDFVSGWTWTNYGTGMPAISISYLGSDTVGQLKNAINEGVFSIKDNMAGATGKVFAFDSKTAVEGGFFNNNPDWGALLPRCGWPGLIPADGEYVLTARLKYESGLAINWGNVQIPGVANLISTGGLTDIPQQVTSSYISDPDENGWYDVEIKFRATDVAGISFSIIPANSVRDTLYITDLELKPEKIDVIITSDTPSYNTIELNEEFSVPTATSNGTSEIKVNLVKPDGTSSEVKMGDKVVADQSGFYRLTYTADDAINTLQITFEVKVKSNNLFITNDENATGFITSNHYYSLMNPYYEGNYGFNEEHKLIVWGQGATSPDSYAYLYNNVEGGNGQVVVLKTNNLSEWRIPSVSFCAEVEAGRTYVMSLRMKITRADGNVAFGPFQTAINYFTSEITDQGNDSTTEWIDQLLDADQKALALAQEWFTITRTITVPETITVNGTTQVPTALVTYFSTSATNDDSQQHEMWFDDVTLTEVHNATKVEAKEATCSENGNIEYYVCEDCGRLFKDEACTQEITIEDTIIPAKGHSATKVEAKEATCSEDGNIEYYECEDCGRLFKDEACSEEITIEDTIIPAKGHSATKVEAKEATCSEDGNIEYYVCEDCGRLFKDEACTQEITIEDTIIKANGHEVEIVNKKEATCTEEGYTGDKVCSKCGEVLEKGEVIPKLDHHYEDGKCSECGKIESVNTADTSHIYGMMSLLVISIIGIFFVIRFKKERQF